MSANSLDEACPMCDTDVTFGKAHVESNLNRCPTCGHEWNPDPKSVSTPETEIQ